MDGITMEWAIPVGLWPWSFCVYCRSIARVKLIIRWFRIPQIGEMLGLFDMKPYRLLVSKMIGGVLTGFAGFSVSREDQPYRL